MEIDAAPFWENLFIYSYEEEYMSSLISPDKIKERHFHWTTHFIDDLCAINDGEIEDQRYHATFLNLDIIIKEGTFIYTFFDKRLVSFSIVRMLHIESNTPENNFHLPIKGELLRIACSTQAFYS